MTQAEALNRIADALFALRDEATAWRRSTFPFPRPKPFAVTLISERTVDSMDFLTYEATLPAVPPNTDVASQELRVVVNGTPQATQGLPKEATTATFEVEQGSSVELSLVYVDDGGNNSAPRTQEFVANDTIAPDAPGDFQEIKVISERTE